MLKFFRFLTIMTLLSMAGGMAAQSVKNGVKTPDFAFPETVSAQARKNLDEALAKGNDNGVLRSLLDYTLAQGSVSSTNVPACLAKIDSVRNASNDNVLRGMLATLEAVIYNNVYSTARWTYDQRTAPAFPLPADYTEWTGGQFR